MAPEVYSRQRAQLKARVWRMFNVVHVVAAEMREETVFRLSPEPPPKPLPLKGVVRALVEMHTDACLVKKAGRALERSCYRAFYPKYCTHCHGEGGVASSYDPSPPGVGLSPGDMYDWEDCLFCLAKGICPRCGTENHESWRQEIEDKDAPCPACKLVVFTDNAGLPPLLECDCFLGIVGMDGKLVRLPGGHNYHDF